MSWVSFFAKGKDAGFSFKEIELLRQLAVQNNLEHPASLFFSQIQLDACIRALVLDMKTVEEGEEQEKHDFLARLYEFRKKLEMDKSKKKSGITSSLQMEEGQVLRVLVAGSGVFKSRLIKNTSQYMTISRPVNSKNSSAYKWQGSTISVYFWREDDAGYVFDARVEDEIYSKGFSSLKITHGESLFRTQKRKSVRVKVQKPAYLYMAMEDEPPNKLEIDPGLKCYLEDLSDTGCAVVVGGKASSGLKVKVQFGLDNIPVCMTGTVRSTTFKEDTNRSVLRIEAEDVPIEMRNLIFGEIFGMTTFNEEEDLPFRIIDGDAAHADAEEGESLAPVFAEDDGLDSESKRVSV